MVDFTDDTLEVRQIFRSVMGRFVTGVTIVTAASHAGPVGMTVNAFTSVSLDPCLVLVCLKRRSITGIAIREAGSYGVNVLSSPQDALALRFARPVEDRFQGVDYLIGQRDVPLLLGCTAYLECDLESVTDAGDHEIFLGRVIQAAHEDSAEPLVYCHAGFGGYAPRAAVA